MGRQATACPGRQVLVHNTRTRTDPMRVAVGLRVTYGHANVGVIMKIWVAAAVLMTVPTFATAQMIRCGGKLIGEGSSRAEVEAACGEPTQVDSGAVYHGTVAATGQSNVVRGTAVAQPVEIWTYNFGPSMLMQRIRFVDGVVVSMEHLGYGYPLP
jgi:hypothetical protein